MADLIVIIGPPAVGKASVGAALAAKTGFKLFHNHLTVEPVAAMMGWDHPRFAELVWQLRITMFHAVLADDTHPGVIFTFVWAFDVAEDTAQIVMLRDLFLAHGHRVRFVELTAELEARLAREGTPQRLRMKPSKHDVEWARAHARQAHQQYQLSSSVDFPWPNELMHIDTEQHQPDAAAQLIVQHWAELFATATV